MTNASPIRVCIIEDHVIVRAGLKLLLDAQPDLEVVGEAVDKEGSFEVVARERPDILIVDLQLGKESALDFLDELLQVCDARAIIVTGTSIEHEIHRAIHAGAMGLVYKDEDPEVLVRAIRKVQAGEAWLSRSVMTSALGSLRGARASRASTDPDAAKLASLTAREREIVILVANGFDRRRIAETLFLSEGTVRNHLSSVFAKLELPNQLALVFYAQRRGLDRAPHPALESNHPGSPNGE